MTTSRQYQTQWTYSEADDGLDGTVGRLLSPSFQGCSHTLTASGTRSRRAFSGLRKSASIPSSQASQENLHTLSSGKDCTPTTLTTNSRSEPLHVWVNGAGQVVRDDRGKQERPSVLLSVAPPECPPHLLPEVVRRRIHPGMMRDINRIPDSTMQDHFRWAAAHASAHGSFKHHLRKTDFSKYNEAAAQCAKHLITDKGGSSGSASR